jgi:NAD-dependent SIR2 family protein deacetylase
MISTARIPEQAYCTKCHALVAFVNGTTKITEGVSVRTARCPGCDQEIVRVGGARDGG